VLSETCINTKNVRALAEAAEVAWKGLKKKDIKMFSKGFLDSFNAQIRMFPKMVNPEIQKVIENNNKGAFAWKLAGAGGGGYLILISEKKISNSFRIKIRMKESWL
jgi:galactokinase/mevalonate kinase-like predicted kinase